MTADGLFLKKLSKLKKRFIFQTVRRVVLIAIIVFLFSYTAALGLEMTGMGQYRHSIGFYFISVAISIATSLGYAYIKRKRFMQILIEIDSRLNLNDTIATAYEYQSMRKTSVFKPQLLEDAAQKLSHHSIRQLVPGTYSFIHVLFLILILTNGILLFMDRFSFASKQAEPVYEPTSAITHLPQNRVAPKKKSVKKTEPVLTPKTNRTLEKFAQQLNDPSMTRNKLVTALNEMLEEIQSEHTLLAKDAHATTQTGSIDRQPIQTIQKKESLSLQRLKDLFQGILSDKIPDKIGTDTALLEERQRFNNLLSQIIESIDRIESDQQGVPESSKHARSKRSRQRDYSKRNKKGSNYNDPNDMGSEGNQPTDNLADGAYPGQDPDFWGDGQDYREDWEDFSDSPGHAKSKGGQQSPNELESKKGPALQDKTISAKRDDYSVHIRSLTGIGKATVEQQDVPREYQQEIENILQKEEIPLNYREYIRNYFISIGLRKDEK